MNYISQTEFKAAIKQNKAISAAIRKDFTGPVQITGDRQAKFTFSSESVDRDFDVIKQAGIDLTHFIKNPVIFWGHEHSDLPIGKCISVGLEGGNLVGVIEFAPANNPAVGDKAEGIFQLCKEGFLSTVSIGFVPKSIEYPDGERLTNDGVDVTECELVECSVVGIPSNRDALIQNISSEPLIQVAKIPQSEAVKTHGPARRRRILASLD